MRLSFRQGIVQHQTDTFGTPTFLDVNGGYVSLITTNDPTIITFVHGDKDYLYTERQTQTNAWGPFTSGDQWLYWQLNPVTGEREFGSTNLEPVLSPTAPLSPGTGQMWFNTVFNMWYEFTGSSWVEVIRVFVCKLVNSTTPVSMSINAPDFRGTQVGLTTPTRSGALTFDLDGKPIRSGNRKFFTTEDPFVTGVSTSAQLRVNNIINSGIASQALHKYQVVEYFNFNYLVPANPFSQGKKMIGIIEDDVATGEVADFVIEGMIFNENWDWPGAGGDINDPVYFDNTGDISLTPAYGSQLPVGLVVGEQEIMFSPRLFPQVDIGIAAQYFTELVDTPVDFTGSANFYLTVNGTEDAIVLTPFPTINVNWGTIGGSINLQTDLISLLDDKAAVAHSHLITDVSGLQTQLSAKLETEVNDLTAAVTWATVPDTFISPSSVLQHQGLLVITEAQISDLGNYEPAFTKNTGFNLDLGTTAGTIAHGNHVHVKANITDFNDADYATAAQGALADTALQDITTKSIRDLVDVLDTMTPIDGQVLTYDNVNGWQAETFTSGVTDHTLLSNIGIHSHDQIDMHLTDSTVHFTMAGITITESQISDLGSYEPAFSKNTGFNLNLGTIAGTVAEGNHTHIKADIINFNDADYATAAQGALADTALQDITSSTLNDLSDVLTSMSPVDGHFLAYNTVNGWYSSFPPSGITDHTALTTIGINSHDDIDTHIADTTIHFVDAPSDGSTYGRLNGAWAIVTGGGGGATNLNALTDVTLTAAVKGDLFVFDGSQWVDLTVGINGQVLVADSAQTTGVKWETVAGASEVNDLTAAVVWDNIPDANVPQTAITQHQGSLSITESQISDLQSYLLDAPSDGSTYGRLNGSWAVVTGGGAEVNDLTSVVTWANVPDANITQTSVVQHQGSLSITESQISDLQSYLLDAPSDGSTYGRLNGAWAVVTGGGGIANIIEDLTPQLGGNLDTNGFEITGGTNALDIRGGVSGGTGQTAILWGGHGTSGAGGHAQVIAGDASSGSFNSGDISLAGGKDGISGGRVWLLPGHTTAGVSGDVYIQGRGGSNTNAGLRFLEPASVGVNYVKLVAPSSITTDRTWVLPQDDPSTVAGQFITTDASGNLSFAVGGGGGGLANIVEDTTPQLGGTLDTNTFAININTAASGVTPSTWVDDLVIHNNDNAGLTIATPNTASGLIAFADPENNFAGSIRYTHSTNRMSFSVSGNSVFELSSTRGFYLQETLNTVAATFGYGALYVKASDSELYYKDDSGTETQITGLTSSGLTDIVNDLTPQLGGDLDVNGNDITSTSDIVLDCNTTITCLREPSGSSTVATVLEVVTQVATGNVLTGMGSAIELLSRSGGGVDSELAQLVGEYDDINGGIFKIKVDNFSGYQTAISVFSDQHTEFENHLIIAEGSVPGTPASGYGALYVKSADSKLYFMSDAGAEFDLTATGGGGGLANLIEDTTPQLGGDLDVNGQKITSVSNADIDIEPNGTGNVLLGNFVFDADQAVTATEDGYGLTYDHASGTIRLVSGGGAGISNVVEDLTPELGGALDTNGNNIFEGTAYLTIVELGTTRLHAGDLATGRDLDLEAGNSTSNGNGGAVRINAGTGGSSGGTGNGGTAYLVAGDSPLGNGGHINIEAGDTSVTTTKFGGNVNISAGNGGNTVGGDIILTVGNSNGNLPGDVRIRPFGSTSTPLLKFIDTGGTNYVSLQAPTTVTSIRSWVLPQDDPASVAGQFLTTDASGNLSFAAGGGGGISNVVEDTTPQLGGNLDVNGNDIVSVSNGDINITPNGTGKTKVTNLEAPTPLNTQTGTTYTAVLADADKMITLDNASAITMTIPANASVAYPVGTKLNFMQLGAGQVTVAITTDTLNVEASLTTKLKGQYATATAMKVTSTSWVLFGNMESA